MSDRSAPDQRFPEGRAPLFEWWMVANLAVGMGQFAFVPMLIVPYVIGVSGRPADGGVVLSIIGLAAVTAPALGAFADRYAAHRLVFVLGLFAQAAAYALYAWSAVDQVVYGLVAIVFGVGIAAVQAVGPAFIVAIGLAESLQAKRLGAYNLLTSAGLVIGGLLLVATATWPYPRKFLLAAGAISLVSLVVWLATARPAGRIRPRSDVAAVAGAVAGAQEGQRRPGALRQVLRTRFGVLLLMLVFTGIGYNATIGQIANIMGQTFGYPAGTTSTLLAVSGLVNMGGFLFAGFWMARSGALTVVTGAQLLHLLGLAGLALLSLATGSVVVAAGLFMLCFYSAEPFGRIPQPVLAVRFSSLDASTATGWYIAVLAGSASIGGLLAGLLAQVFSYAAILWMAGAAFAIGLCVNAVGLWPAERRKRAVEHRPGRHSPAGARQPAR